MRNRIGPAAWLLLLAAVQATAFGLIWRLFVRTEPGQSLDTIALTGNTIGRRHIEGLVSSVLNAMTIAALVFTAVVIGVIALVRGRAALAAVVTLFIVGTNVTVQALKHVIDRPDFGVDPQRAAAGNSLPSGHTAVAAAFAIALVLVLPPRLRGAGAVFGAGYTALAGVATLSQGWHRPSDSVAAILVAGAWAAVAGVLLILLQRPTGSFGSPGSSAARYGDKHPLASRALLTCAAGLLAIAAVTLALTGDVVSIPPNELSRRYLLTAYAGSAGGIAGTACLVMSQVVAMANRVVPERDHRSRGPASASRLAPGSSA